MGEDAIDLPRFPLEIAFAEDARLLDSDLAGWWAFGFNTMASKDNEAAPGMVAAEVRRLAETVANHNRKGA